MRLSLVVALLSTVGCGHTSTAAATEAPEYAWDIAELRAVLWRDTRADVAWAPDCQMLLYGLGRWSEPRWYLHAGGGRECAMSYGRLADVAYYLDEYGTVHVHSVEWMPVQ